MQAKAQPPKLSPLHDSAGSQQSLDDRDGSEVSLSSFSSEEDTKRHNENYDRLSEVSGGQAKALEQDAAHFVGIPQKSRSRIEPQYYQLCSLAQAGSFLVDNGEVSSTLQLHPLHARCLKRVQS